MTILHAFILGIVEGLTEFVPVSSTAHLSLAASVMKLAETDFLKSFTVIIQFGAILAVCVIFFRLVWEYREKLVPRVIAGFIPTALIGFVLYKFIKGYLIGNIFVSGITLLVGGIVFLVVEYLVVPRQGRVKGEYPSVLESGAVGAAQALAVIPGISRSGAIIIYGLLRGYSREIITTFAFLLAVPTMFAASAYDLYKSGPSFTGHEWVLLVVGFATSFVVAYIVSKWFISYISKHTFKIFGWYRIAIGLAIILVPIILK